MARNRGNYVLDKAGVALLNIYKSLYVVTDGLFTPLIGNVLADAGYDSGYSLEEKEIKKPFSWEEAIFYKPPVLQIKEPAVLDFGGIGKGFLIDEIKKTLELEGIKIFCIDGSGDILYINPLGKEIKIGLENPINEKQVIGVATILNQSICASSGNRRKWGRFHHIINPKTLTSPGNILATWVVAKEAVTADSLATCLFLVKPEKLKEFDFEYLILNSDFSINKSANFPCELYTINR